ncbi:MAG: multiheme c-type cytochrome [Kofleriaceae bacterium]
MASPGIWVALILAAACCHRDDVRPAAHDTSVPTRPSFTIFALAEVRGQIGPCGCTSDPLGDISRTTELVAQARKAGPVVVVDAGSLLYSQNPVPAHLVAQEDLKADLLATIYTKQLEATAVGLGPADTAMGPAKERFPRVESNVTAGYATKPPQIAVVGGQRIGVFGVIAEDAFKVQISDPIAAGKQAVQLLRGQGAQLVIALVQASTKKDAIALAKAIGGIDFAIAGLGQNAPEPDAIDIEPTKLDYGPAGTGWLVIPGDRGQIVSRIDVYTRAGTATATPSLTNAIGPAAAKATIARLDQDLASRDAELARFAADPTADHGFVAAKRQERAELAAQRANLERQPLAAPATGSFFTLDQVKIAKALACSITAQDEVTAFYAAAGAANVKAAAGKAPEPAAKGKASYVGSASCGDCHDDAAKFWAKTVHAQAWKTLVDRGQQFDYDCIGCHVTGWQQPGGSNLAFNEPLRDVQCETCHGPASIHVAKSGEEKPLAIVRDPPENLCATQCHTHEHSDTFQHDAYLRDIVGPGHGEKRRAKLGDGPTGQSLRKAALDKAGKSLGANCTR